MEIYGWSFQKPAHLFYFYFVFLILPVFTLSCISQHIILHCLHKRCNINKVWTELNWICSPSISVPSGQLQQTYQEKIPGLDAFPFRLIWVKINLIYRAYISLMRFRPVSHSQARLIVISHSFICSFWRSISQPLCWHESPHARAHTLQSQLLESRRVIFPFWLRSFPILCMFCGLMVWEFKCHSFLIGSICGRPYRAICGVYCIRALKAL